MKTSVGLEFGNTGLGQTRPICYSLVVGQFVTPVHLSTCPLWKGVRWEETAHCTVCTLLGHTHRFYLPEMEFQAVCSVLGLLACAFFQELVTGVSYFENPPKLRYTRKNEVLPEKYGTPGEVRYFQRNTTPLVVGSNPNNHLTSGVSRCTHWGDLSPITICSEYCT